jgi:hypothetical protein
LRSYTNRDCRVRCFGGHLSVLGASGLPRRPLDDDRNDWGGFRKIRYATGLCDPIAPAARAGIVSDAENLAALLEVVRGLNDPLSVPRRCHKTTGLVNDCKPELSHNTIRTSLAQTGVWRLSGPLAILSRWLHRALEDDARRRSARGARHAAHRQRLEGGGSVNLHLGKTPPLQDTFNQTFTSSGSMSARVPWEHLRAHDRVATEPAMQIS